MRVWRGEEKKGAHRMNKNQEEPFLMSNFHPSPNLPWGSDASVASIQHHAEVFSDASRLCAILHLQVGRYSHVDFFAVGRNTIQKRSVVHWAVPGSFEAEEHSVGRRWWAMSIVPIKLQGITWSMSRGDPVNWPVISRLLNVVCREQVEGKHCMLPIYFLPLWSVANAPNHKLFDIPPDEVRAVLMHNGDGHASLDALVEQVGPQAGHVLIVLHHSGNISEGSGNSSREAQHTEVEDWGWLTLR